MPFVPLTEEELAKLTQVERNKYLYVNQKRLWIINHPEQYEATRQAYYEKNKEKMLVYSKAYYEKHKDEKVTCPCGSIVKRPSLSSHKKTLKHRTYLDSLESDDK